MKWWAYIHSNGTLQIKRYFDEQDIDEAHESPFVKKILPIVDVESREEAENTFIAYLAKEALKNI